MALKSACRSHNLDVAYRTLHPFYRYALALTLFLLALWLRMTLWPVNMGLAFVTFYPVILITFYLGGLGPGTLLVLLSGLAGNYFFLQPYYEFSLTPDEIPALVFFTLTSFLCGFTVTRSQRNHAAQEKAQAKLSESEERFHLFMDNNPAISWVKDETGRLVYLNHAFERFFSVKLPDWYGKTDDELWPPEIAAEFRKNDITVLKTWQSLQVVECTYDQEGNQHHWLITKFPFTSTDGHIFVAGIGQDITIQKKAEEALQLLALVTQSLNEAVVIADADNCILAINPAFTRMTGYTAEEAIGQPTKLLKSGRHEKEFYQSFWHTLLTTGRWQGEIWNRRKNGEIYPEWLSITTLYAEDGSIQRRVALSTDISDRKRSEEVIWRQANLDGLTGLPNRVYFRNLLDMEIKRAEREHHKLALLFLDLDRFKEINDTLGHPVGDELLKMTAQRLQNCLRKTDILARFGGDEFIILLTCLKKSTDAETIASHVVNSQKEPYSLDGKMIYISTSAGIAIFPDDAQNADVLLKQADQAMYAAKRGRNGYRFFTASMQDLVNSRRWITDMLRKAINQQQFEVHYQPIVELITGRIHKAEALIRWNHPQRGYISPAEFIPVAEETSLIHDIGDWVFYHAIEQAGRWRQEFHPAFQISVNKSPVQFQPTNSRQNNWISHLTAQGLPGNCLVVEITEGLLMDNQTPVQDKLLEFRDAGIQVAIDDFGTGYSALSYLRKFDIDYLKIDQSFTRKLESGSSELALCKAIVVMAHELGLKVIAEGVETEQQRDLLRDMGCDYGQGYLFAKPMPAEEFEKLLGKF